MNFYVKCGIVIFFGIVLLAVSMTSSLSQSRPTPQQEQPGCPGVVMQYGALPIDAKVQYLLSDGDGDWWIMITITNTGKQMIGFLNHKNAMLCIVGEGKIAPKT